MLVSSITLQLQRRLNTYGDIHTMALGGSMGANQPVNNGPQSAHASAELRTTATTPMET